MAWARHRYDTFYRQINYERRELFALLLKELGQVPVLYPACAIHITPSFYFRKIVYIDRSDEAARFFYSRESVLSIINSEKNYKGSPDIVFYHADFSEDAVLPQSSFGLILSLYGGSLVRYFQKQIGPQTMILSADDFSGLQDFSSGEFIVQSAIRAHNGKYTVDRSVLGKDPAELPEFQRKRKIGGRLGRFSSYLGGKQPAFKDNQNYFLFKVNR